MINLVLTTRYKVPEMGRFERLIYYGIISNIWKEEKMPLFVCDKCGAIDNTALGFYWSRNRVNFKDPALKGMALCTRCVPEEYDDGSKTGYNGKWHNKFPLELYEDVKDTLLEGDIINRRK